MSDYIEIDKKPVIFNHEQNCTNNQDGCGFKISAEKNFHWCFLFRTQLHTLDFVKKCAECKEEWEKISA
jgi:hypothetical protein